MKRFLSLGLSALTTATVAFSTPIKPANAIPFREHFDEEQVDEEKFVAIAVPFGHKNYSLAIIEQISRRKQCWRERGHSPVTVEPLLLNFDFTNVCRRATDTNGYSVRIDGQDRRNYRLKIVERDGELHLVATHPDPYQPEILVGRSHGLDRSKQITKIFLSPGWSLSKRVYQGRTLDHFYLSGDSREIAESWSDNWSSPEYDHRDRYNRRGHYNRRETYSEPNYPYTY